MIEMSDPLVPQTLYSGINRINLMQSINQWPQQLPFACVSQRAAALISHNLMIPLDDE